MNPYHKYLIKIADRIKPEWPYICSAVKRDKWWILNPFACRLMREIKKMVERSRALHAERYHGKDRTSIYTIELALEEKYNVRLGNLADDYHWRVRWLLDLADDK